MLAHVPGSSKDSEEDKASRHRGVEHAQENDGWDHERETNFLVYFIAQRSEGGCGVVLSTRVGVDDSTDEREKNDFGDGNSPESFGEISRVLHFSNERGQSDLSNKCVADVHECGHSSNESGTFLWNCKHERLSILGISSRMGLDTREDGGQEDRDEGEECRSGTQQSKSAKSTGKRRDEGNGSNNGAESDCAETVTSHGVEIFGTGQAMQALDESVVQDEHEGSGPPCPSLTPEQHLSNVADILYFRVTQAELPTILSDTIRNMSFAFNIPENERGVQDQSGNDDGQDQTGYQAESSVRVWERHDSQADVLRKQQCCSLEDGLGRFLYARRKS